MSLTATSPDVWADQGYLQDLPQLPYMPVCESLYASQSMYKTSSEPSSNAEGDRPHMSPAQQAGVHVVPDAQGVNPRDASMFTYSSEPTAMASSSMVHPLGRRLSESQFHDVAWVSRAVQDPCSLSVSSPNTSGSTPSDTIWISRDEVSLMHADPTLQIQALMAAYLHGEAFEASITMKRSSGLSMLSSCWP